MNSIQEKPARNLWSAMRRGGRRVCPSCGQAPLFRRFLKVADICGNCGEELHHHRADDAPPYFTIFIVGHLVVPLALWTERLWKPDMWIHMVLWLPLAVLVTLLLLPVVKGVIVGLQWALFMHGFELAAQDDHDIDSDPSALSSGAYGKEVLVK